MIVAVCSDTCEITLKHKKAAVTQKNALNNNCLTGKILRILIKISC